MRDPATHKPCFSALANEIDSCFIAQWLKYGGTKVCLHQQPFCTAISFTELTKFWHRNKPQNDHWTYLLEAMALADWLAEISINAAKLVQDCLQAVQAVDCNVP